jgi:hypothetical protein
MSLQWTRLISDAVDSLRNLHEAYSYIVVTKEAPAIGWTDDLQPLIKELHSSGIKKDVEWPVSARTVDTEVVSSSFGARLLRDLEQRRQSRVCMFEGRIL